MTTETESRSAREVALASFEGVRKRDLDQIVADGHPEHYLETIGESLDLHR